MTRTKWTLRDLESGRLDWRSLLHFVRHLPIDSATYRATHSDDLEAVEWASGRRAASILADLVDTVQVTNAILTTKPGSKIKSPKPYPRPWKTGEQETKRFGKDPIPASQIREWYYA